MGVEMALLRALAFHPKSVIEEIEAPPRVITQTVTQSAPQRGAPPQTRAENLPENSPTLQLLKARQTLQSPQSEDPGLKKAKPATSEKAKPAVSALERLAAVTSKHQQNVENKASQGGKLRNQSRISGKLRTKKQWLKKMPLRRQVRSKKR
ncbi:hypothetical protein AB6G58_22205 [Providencia huaxiensis]